MGFRELNRDICYKQNKGKILWQPRIDCWIKDRLFEHGELPGKYKGMSKSELYKELGCSARPYEFNDCFIPVYDESVVFSEEQNAESTISHCKTPVGEVNRIEKSTPSSWAKLVTKEWVETQEDLKVYTYIENHTNWRFDSELYCKLLEEWGELGEPCMFMPRVSIQRLYIDLMGVENTVYALYDFEGAVQEYLSALRECHFRLIDVINESPIDIINFGDNIHSGTLSPGLFDKYILKEYQSRCERLHKAGKFTYSHFDGDNRGLMEFYKHTGLEGIEAVTPVPQGDVEIEDVKKHMGDMTLFDGIPAILFNETFSEEELVRFANRVIGLFAPNLVLGISDEMSSAGDIERIRLVGKIVDEYNAKF